MSKTIIIQGRSGKSPSPQTNNPKKKSKRNRPQRQRKDLVVVARKTITPCAVDFLHSVTDPFGYSNTGRLPCIPDTNVEPSFKFYTIARGTLAIGTGGYGYVMVAPYTANVSSVYGSYTTSAYAGTSTTALLASGTGISTFNDARWPFAGARAFRVVACGLRVAYTGTELNRGGLIVPFSSTQASGDFSVLTYDQVMARVNVKAYPTSRAKRGVTWVPGYSSSSNYTNDNGAGDTVNYNRLGIFLSGTAGNTFTYEVIRYIEAIPDGTNGVYGTSMSDSDMDGFSIARDFLGRVIPTEMGEGLWNRAVQFVKTVAVPAAAVAGQQYLQARLGYAGNNVRYSSPTIEEL